ncbi:hypothetical protein J6590_030228 [Homalodisca vitripennis]|nr:hypothetical protein J6590_030228 [Homalodisca vitripennis]
MLLSVSPFIIILYTAILGRQVAIASAYHSKDRGSVPDFRGRASVYPQTSHPKVADHYNSPTKAVPFDSLQFHSCLFVNNKRLILPYSSAVFHISDPYWRSLFTTTHGTLA